MVETRGKMPQEMFTLPSEREVRVYVFLKNEFPWRSPSSIRCASRFRSRDVLWQVKLSSDLLQGTINFFHLRSNFFAPIVAGHVRGRALNLMHLPKTTVDGKCNSKPSHTYSSTLRCHQQRKQPRLCAAITVYMY